MTRRGNGEGTIFKRKNGNWSAQTYVTLVNGKKKRASVTAESYEAIKKKLRKIKDQDDRRIPFAEKDWTIAEYLDYWIQDIQSNRIRETTLIGYNVLIKNHIKPVMSDHKIKDLSVYDVRNALEALREKGCSERVRLECLRVLSACLNCAMREELIFRNVAQMVEKPKYIPKETVIWTTEQAIHFVQTAKDHPQLIAFLLLLTYGMRRGEVLGLRWCDIDFDNGLIHVRQQIDRINGAIKARELKTSYSSRSLPLIEFIHDSLMTHAIKNGITPQRFNPYFELSTQGTVVVSKTGTPLESRNLARCFNSLIEKAGLPRIKIHALRHTAATILKDLNVPVKDVQLILGHSNISTTLNIYQHGTSETRHAAISAVGERLLTAPLYS